jgi:hypothetical protein
MANRLDDWTSDVRPTREPRGFKNVSHGGIKSLDTARIAL